MQPDHSAEICDLLARLADVVESFAQAAGDKNELFRLPNIRHDTLCLRNRLSKAGPSDFEPKRKGWFRRAEIQPPKARISTASEQHCSGKGRR